MSGYLERLVRRAAGRSGPATLRPRREAPAAAEETFEASPATIVEVEQDAVSPAPRPLAPPIVAPEGPSVDEASVGRSTAAIKASRATSPQGAAPSPPASEPSHARAETVPAAPQAAGSRPVTRADRAPSSPPPTASSPTFVHADGAPPRVVLASVTAPTIAKAPAPAPATTASAAVPATTTSREKTSAPPPAHLEAEVEEPGQSIVTTLVARRAQTAAPQVPPPWAASRGGRDDERADSDAVPQIEVHIDRVEVVQPAPVPFPLPAPPSPPPRHRGFAALEATRSHSRRRWC